MQMKLKLEPPGVPTGGEAARKIICSPRKASPCVTISERPTAPPTRSAVASFGVEASMVSRTGIHEKLCLGSITGVVTSFLG